MPALGSVITTRTACTDFAPGVWRALAIAVARRDVTFGLALCGGGISWMPARDRSSGCWSLVDGSTFTPLCLAAAGLRAAAVPADGRDESCHTTMPTSTTTSAISAARESPSREAATVRR